MNAAQNQHYVPKFILRKFLSNEAKEQVSVFDKRTSRTFQTSIKNIMAERRYNDFVFNDVLFSAEDMAGRLENIAIPAYNSVVKNRSVNPGDAQQRADLALLIAFQFARTKSSRQMLVDLKSAIKDKIADQADPAFLAAYFGLEEDEEAVKQASLISLREELPLYMDLISTKVFFLMSAPQGRSFYLGDDPVILHNERPNDGYGNLGLAVRGIQISMPITADLLLCAWCPTVFHDIEREITRLLPEARQMLLDLVLANRISAAEMKQKLADFGKEYTLLKEAVDTGKPLTLTAENMDFYNAKQMATAHRYVICQKADFALAKRFNAEHPEARRSFKIG